MSENDCFCSQLITRSGNVAVRGPDVNKGEGAAFASRYSGPGASGCIGRTPGSDSGNDPGALGEVILDGFAFVSSREPFMYSYTTVASVGIAKGRLISPLKTSSSDLGSGNEMMFI